MARLIVLLSACLVALTAGQCPPDYVYYGGTNKCFLFVYHKYFTWDGAQAECLKTGGNLVSISNKEENSFIANIYADSDEDYFPWIGLSRPPPTAGQSKYDGWAWVDGNNATFRRFENEYFYQNASYAMLEFDEEDWTTAWAGTTNRQPYICSAPAQFSANCPLRPPCSTGWSYLADSNSCYKTFFNKDFKGAEGVCVQNGGHLAVIKDEIENDFVGGLAETGIRQDELRQIWVGFYKSENGTWIGVDGSDVRFFNFGPGMPDNLGNSENCVQMFADPWSEKLGYQYKWNDINCQLGLRAFVCKKNALF